MLVIFILSVISLIYYVFSLIVLVCHDLTQTLLNRLGRHVSAIPEHIVSLSVSVEHNAYLISLIFYREESFQLGFFFEFSHRYPIISFLSWKMYLSCLGIHIRLVYDLLELKRTESFRKLYLLILEQEILHLLEICPHDLTEQSLLDSFAVLWRDPQHVA